MNLFGALLAGVLAQAHYTAAEAQAIFQEANEAYSRGELDVAKEAYGRLVEHGYAGPDVLYNLGTAHLAAGELGEAVLQLERSKKLSGRDDVAAQLAHARAQQLDQVVGAQAETPFLHRLAEQFPPAQWGWVLLVGWGLGFCALIAWQLLPAGSRRRAAGWVAALGLCVGLASGVLVAVGVYVETTVEEAVVLAQTLQAKELPSVRAKVAFEVHAGLKVRVLEEADGHVRIRLPNGLEGWAVREGVARL